MPKESAARGAGSKGMLVLPAALSRNIDVRAIDTQQRAARLEIQIVAGLAETPTHSDTLRKYTDEVT